MVAAPPPPGANQIRFEFLDVTNLSSPDAGRMQSMVLTWKNDSQITQEWTWREKGKPDQTGRFEFSRRK